MKSNKDIDINGMGRVIYLYSIIDKSYMGQSFEYFVPTFPKNINWTTVKPDALIDNGDLFFDLSVEKWVPQISRDMPYGFNYLRLEFSKADWEWYSDGKYHYLNVLGKVHLCGTFPNVQVQRFVSFSCYSVCIMGKEYEVEIRENDRVLIICRTDPFDGRLSIKY